jgi:type IV secretory pathway VirB4 component
MNPEQQFINNQAPAQGVNMAQTQQGAGAPLNQSASKANPNSTQNSLLISEIRDGIVIMSDGSFRSVIMCKSINFDLMSPQEREGVEYAFQGFLNSLYYPIQIFIRSQKIDLRPYIQKLEKVKSEHQNMLLALLMEDYISYITDVSYRANIMDKTFYIVIPFFPTGIDAGAIKSAGKNFLSNIFGSGNQHVVINEADLEKAKTELRNRVQASINGLAQAGIQSLPLDTQELIELYYDVYNPDTATRQPLKNFNDLSTPVVIKGVGENPYGGATQ